MTTKTSAKKATKTPTAKAPAKKAAPKAKAPAKKAAPKGTRPDVITEVKNTVGKEQVAVSAAAGTVYIDRVRMTGELAKLAAVGASLKAVQTYLKEHKPEARLARGLNGRDAPQSAAAAAASRQKAAPAAKAPKAAKTAQKRASGARGDRKYAATKKAVEARVGTWRHYMLTTIMAHGSTDAANAAHAKSKEFSGKKLDFNWAAREGHITFAA